jgi:hypothetical protein
MSEPTYLGNGWTAVVDHEGDLLLERDDCDGGGLVVLDLPAIRALIVTLMGDATIASVIRGAVKDGAA